ncbi:transmembrane protein UsgS [Geopyxis carbonaria]|nr:transmembrane protein UsgS [Geopyxis carbonaria]
MSNFDPNAIIRGAQLTLVGAYRALQNPKLFNNTHYKQAAIAVISGIAIRIIISAPIFIVRLLLWVLGYFVDLQTLQWDTSVISGLEFIEKSVLQLPLFMMSMMRYITPTLDDMFMKSLEWVDHTYTIKHQTEDPSKLRPLYCPTLSKYEKNIDQTPGHRPEKMKKATYRAAIQYGKRYARRAGLSFMVYMLSFLPYIGPFVLPVTSFYAFNEAVGIMPASVIFGTGFFLPKRWMIIFLQGFFSSRSLMRELLEPYFSRIKFTKEQKKEWFRERQGLLFGFGVGFYLILKVPLLGVLIYGIAEASTAMLITKITDPPPPPSESTGFAETQIRWKNKHEFLKLHLHELDGYTDNRETQ